jgi:hypothetical protein
MDADLYSSTKCALDSIGPFINEGCIIIFDEFHGFDDDLHGEEPGETGEARAWREFAKRTGIQWQVIGHGREQWAVKITKPGVFL